jgi:hypothetical protein
LNDKKNWETDNSLRRGAAEVCFSDVRVPSVTYAAFALGEYFPWLL